MRPVAVIADSCGIVGLFKAVLRHLLPDPAADPRRGELRRRGGDRQRCGEPRPTAATPVDNLYCSCKLNTCSAPLQAGGSFSVASRAAFDAILVSQRRLCPVCVFPLHLPCVATTIVAKTPPLPCVFHCLRGENTAFAECFHCLYLVFSTAFAAKTPPLPCVSTASVAATPPLPL